MKLYTRTGDKGRSSLASGERVAKNDLRMKAYGDVDELNSLIGGIIAEASEFEGRLSSQLTEIQSDLFSVGAWLATTPDSTAASHLTPVTDAHEKKLESQIDEMQKDLSELRSFILPGGHTSAVWAHIARTVCRRAERSTIDLLDALPTDNEQNTLRPILIYLNRLSDYLFVVARTCNKAAGVKDIKLK